MSPFVKLSAEIFLKTYLGITSFGDNMHYYDDLPSNFIIIPRNSDGEVVQIPTEPCHIFHYGFAKEENNKISFTTVQLGKSFNMNFDYKLWLSNSSVAPGKFYLVELDL